jgi:Metallopeptidase family M24
LWWDQTEYYQEETMDHPEVFPIRKRAEIVNRNLQIKLDDYLPGMMREHGIDMWLMACQEDNYDQVMESMIPYECWFKILNFIILFDRGPEKGIERIDLGFSRTGGLYEKPWKGHDRSEQWEMLPKLIAERDPKRIALNTGKVNWAVDGLSHGLYQQMVKHVPQKYVDRFESAEPLATHWLMTHTDEDLELYQKHVGPLAHWVMRTILTSEYITPGKTTTEDLNWEHWQLCNDLGVEPSFKPNYYIKRQGVEGNVKDDLTIREGDMVFCDVGVKYLRLYTDMKEWVYIRRPGETDVPEGFKELMKHGNRLQDIYLEGFRDGWTGNQILVGMLERAHSEGLPNPKVYSHSCGLFVHEPGPLIGLPWEQKDTGGRGEVPMRINSTYTMELSVAMPIPAWDNQVVILHLEQDVMFTRDGCKMIDGRQTEFYLL